MRSLIIGGSGFVGRNLALALTEQNHEVAVLDRVPDSTGLFQGEYFQGDAQNPEVVEKVLKATKPFCVYHLAANSDISAGVADASLDFGDTLMTTIALTQAAQVHPVEQIVFASSSAIFGKVEGPIAETVDQYFEPESWYGKAKLASEYVLRSFSAVNTQTKVLITRFPNVVGPLATHGVVFDFIRKLRDTPNHLQVLGDGFQAKPYVHVSDLIQGIEFFRAGLTYGETQFINIGPIDTISVREIAGIVVDVLRLDPEISYQDSAIGWVGDIPRYEFNATRMRNLGFNIETTSQEAVRRAASDLAAEILSR